MSIHKTKADTSVAKDFLSSYFKTEGIEVERLGWGEESQAFYFSFSGDDYVLRLSSHGTLEYKKDQIAFNEFSSDELPVPEVIEIGKVDERLSFAITRRVPGKTLKEFRAEEVKCLNSDIIMVLGEIHKIKAPGYGYGGWGTNRNGPFKTWKEYLLASLEQDEDKIKPRPYYDASMHEVVKEEIRKLIDYCPEERSVLHGDFGDLNLLSDGLRITGVIDWGDSLYGDPLKDIASWSQREGFLEDIKEYYEKRGGIPKNFDERIKCYRLLNAYAALWFYAYSDQVESYNKCVADLAGLIIKPKSV